jgi:methylated-DNA-[protein]-cysteine S-methyltransferase
MDQFLKEHTPLMHDLSETFANPWFSATFVWTSGLLSRIDLRAETSAATKPQSPYGTALQRIVTEYPDLETDEWPDLPLDTRNLTVFTLNVLQNLRLHAPRGVVTSYGRLAALCGSPRAARAVGGVMARNPWPLFYPCHRVLTGSQGIGGFGPGIELKRVLLSLEKAPFPA